jgi:Jacalin-like lectin domain
VNHAEVDADEKKEDDYGEQQQQQPAKMSSNTAAVATSSAEASASTSGGHKIQPIVKSKKLGGDGGEAFNHGQHKVLTKIVVRADDHAIHQLTAEYKGGKSVSNGKAAGDKVETIVLSESEFIVEVKVRHNKLIQSLFFVTNTNKRYGPIGGKGWPKIQLRKDHEGQEESIRAPPKHKLCGFSGAAGDYLDSIVFHWVSIE